MDIAKKAEQHYNDYYTIKNYVKNETEKILQTEEGKKFTFLKTYFYVYGHLIPSKEACKIFNEMVEIRDKIFSKLKKYIDAGRNFKALYIAEANAFDELQNGSVIEKTEQEILQELNTRSIPNDFFNLD